MTETVVQTETSKLAEVVSTVVKKYVDKVPLQNIVVVTEGEAKTHFRTGIPVMFREIVAENMAGQIRSHVASDYLKLTDTFELWAINGPEVRVALCGTGEVEIDTVKQELASALGLEVNNGKFEDIWTGLHTLGEGLPTSLVLGEDGKVKKGANFPDALRAFAKEQSDKNAWDQFVFGDVNVENAKSKVIGVEAHLQQVAELDANSERRVALAVQLILGDETLAGEFVRDLRGSTEAVRGMRLMEAMSSSDRVALVQAFVIFADIITKIIGGDRSQGERIHALGLSKEELDFLQDALSEVRFLGQDQMTGMIERQLKERLVQEGLLVQEDAETMTYSELIDLIIINARKGIASST